MRQLAIAPRLHLFASARKFIATYAVIADMLEAVSACVDLTQKRMRKLIDF